MTSIDGKVLKQILKRTSHLFFSMSLILGSSAEAAFLEPPVMLPSNGPVPTIQDKLDMSPAQQSARKSNTDIFCYLFKIINNQHEKVVIQTILLEAVGEGHEGMVAVGEVIRNRSILFGKNYRDVCLMPKQFSCWNDKKKAEKFLKANEISFDAAKKAWEESQTSVLTRGATDYHATYVQPYWARAYRVTAQVGEHIFYARD